MATSLTPEQRTKLDGIIQQMQANGETDDYIQSVVNDYKAKYAGTASSAPKVAGGYFEGPSHYQENFGGDPLRYIPALPGSPYSISAGQAIDAFPTMGGLVFSVPTGGLGAAAGGASMETLRRSLRGMPLEPGPIAWEGAKQGLASIAGTALGLGARAVSPMARSAQGMAGTPLGKGLGGVVKTMLPLGGLARGGMGGALAGVALPIAGRAALKGAASPVTEAFLTSEAFQTLMRHSPQVATAVLRKALQEEASR